MMRPDELRDKVRNLEGLEWAVKCLRKAETISSGTLYYNGHQSTTFTEDEANVIRSALIEHYNDIVAIKAGRLRNAGVDPSSLLGKEVTA